MEELLAEFDNLHSVAPIFRDAPDSRDGFKRRIDEIVDKVDKLEERVKEVEEFYVSRNKAEAGPKGSGSAGKDKNSKERGVPSLRKQQADATKRELNGSKRMQELIRHMGSIVRQITQHKWAWPFMQPVDVKGLGLEDYFEVIEKPMDFCTIKNQMEARDGSGYKNVRDIYADVRLIFKNAMKYNDVRTDVHVMANTLLQKFDEKWLTLLPKVAEEEKRREEEEAEALVDMQLAQEAAHAKMARDLSNELYEIDTHLDELRELAVQRCRKISTEEKRKLGLALTKLSPEDLTKALEIVSQSNPGFSANAEEVDLDIDAQSESTLWRLKFFVKDALKVQEKTAASMNDNKKNLPVNNIAASNTKRQRENGDVNTKSVRKKSKKSAS